jgi:hypothetical protein
MRNALRLIALILASCLGSGQALPQASLLQAGPTTQNHIVQYSSGWGMQPTVNDAGGSGGGQAGTNPSELGITSVSPIGAYPVTSGGNGPNGEHGCFYDAPTTNATGYHYLCVDPNAAGGGFLSYGAGGSASPLPLIFRINGTNYNLANSTLPTLGTGVTTALAQPINAAGGFVTYSGALGTPTQGVLTNATGLPVSTGLAGTGTGVATALAQATNSSSGIITGLGLGSNVQTALAQSVGTAGGVVIGGGAGGTPSSLTLTNATGLSVSTGLTGLGTGLSTALGLPGVGAGNVMLGNVISTAVTINVPAQYATIAGAMASLNNTRIIPGGSVTISIADGSYACPGEINHVDGALISIVGDTAIPANVTITGSQQNYTPCFLVKNNHALGLIDGMTILASDGYSSPGIWTGTNPYGFGIYAYHGASIIVGYHVTITKFYYAERAELNAHIYNQNNGSTGPSASICGDVCFHAFNGGSIECRYCHASFAGDANQALGQGYLAEAGGSMIVPNSFAANNAIAGFAALNGGSMWAQSTVSGNNGQYGYHAFVRSSLDATSASASYSGVAWVASTAYTQFAWVINGGKLYVEVAASCTSAGSGGPTGTGTAIADNTCTWNYFTTAGGGNAYEADRDGTIVAYLANGNHSGGDGYLTNGGTIDANQAAATFNGLISFHATHIGKIYGAVGAQSGNGTNTPTADATSLANF